MGSVIINRAATKHVFGYSVDDLSRGSYKKVVMLCLDCNEYFLRSASFANLAHRCKTAKDGKRRCYRCKQWMEPTMFAKNKAAASGYANRCRDCFRAYYKGYLQDTSENTSLRIAKVSYWIASRSRAKGLPCDVDPRYMADLWDEQDGRCYYTGLPMQFHGSMAGVFSWHSPSVDRKTPDLGYTRGNLAWCMMGVNAFKGRLTEEEFREAVGPIRWWCR